jgi:serine/threonine-protein kinase
MAKLNQQADDEIAPGTVVDGRYRVVRSIGQGGNGLVYEVEHTRTGRKLALKALLDETGFARLEQEARAASLMKNGHTARIIDMEPNSAQGPYMVMELLEGQSLRGLLDDAGQLPLELTMNLALQICECLTEAHQLGIIHRDLKPENVFLCVSPWPGQHDVKVLDFGVMKIADGGGAIPKSSLTRTGSTVGTPYYMSLEQLRNSSAVDARADVYSLGVVLYECLSGRKPFQADTIGDLVYALCSGPPTHLARLRPDLPTEVADMVMRTLSANRDDRPATMVDLAAALLPHGNAAFALWVKVDGKQPALVPRGPMPSLLEAGSVLKSAAPPASVITSTPMAGPVITPGEGESGWPGPQTKQGWPPAPAAEETGRRDTPTEMYVKGVHGAPEEAPEPAGGGDRDTPTRAYAIEAAPRMMQATLKSPVGLDAPVSEENSTTVDIFSNMQTTAQPPRGAMLTMPIGKQTVPLGAILRGMPPGVQPQQPPQAQMAPLAPLPQAPMPNFKPAWQASIDRGLIAVGRASENLARRFKEAPQNTQIIVVIVASTATLLLLGFLVFLMVG